MNDGMSWYSHCARDYENPPEDMWDDGEDEEEEEFEGMFVPPYEGYFDR